MAEKNKKEQQNTPENNTDIDINTDENQTGTSHLNNPLTEESELEKVCTELEEMKDKYLRKVAEFDNVKRRHAKERLELIQTAGKEVITDLLDVVDDCDRAQKRKIRQVTFQTQSADHPVIWGMENTQYLKFLIIEMQ